LPFTLRISIRPNHRLSTGDNQEVHRTPNADWRNYVNHQPSSMPYRNVFTPFASIIQVMQKGLAYRPD
jgi:hypothetical protein